MKHELVKQLKDAGFPQEGEGKTMFCENHKGPCNEYDSPCNKIYIPTLSELIEACGYDFHLLEKELNTPDYWRCLTIINGKEIRTKGINPEEAVAKLWMELNKKS